MPQPRNPLGEIYTELYIAEPSTGNTTGLYRRGTRVLESITKLEFFNRNPWSSPYLEGLIDCAFLQLTPGTRDGIILDSGFSAEWKIIEGEGTLAASEGVFNEFEAPEEPGITRIGVTVSQDETTCSAECIVTVTSKLFESRKEGDASSSGKKGIPGYTYRKAPGELWRSCYDQGKGIVVINSGHADFIYASRVKSRQLKYIGKLFSKELVLANFPEAGKEQLLERIIELQLYMEENL